MAIGHLLFTLVMDNKPLDLVASCLDNIRQGVKEYLEVRTSRKNKSIPARGSTNTSGLDSATPGHDKSRSVSSMI